MAGSDRIHDIFMSLRGSLTRAVLGIVPSREIEDIVQETYVRMYQFEKKEAIKEPTSFLFKMVRNLALDHIKRAESRMSVSMDDVGLPDSAGAAPSADETFDQVATDEEFALFCESVRHLPVKCRHAFVLRKVYGYSQREIAQEMNLAESTVEKHIAQGIKRCASYLLNQRGKRRGGESDKRNVLRHSSSRLRDGGRQ